LHYITALSAKLFERIIDFGIITHGNQCSQKTQKLANSHEEYNHETDVFAFCHTLIHQIKNC